MGSRAVDSDLLRQQFLTACDRFLPRIEAHARGSSTRAFENAIAGLAQIKEEWARVIVANLPALARMDDTIRIAQDIAQFVANVDIAEIATKSGISTTARGVLGMVQRDVVDLADKLIPAIAADADALLKSGRIPADAIIAHVRAIVRADESASESINCIAIGPIIARAVRHCAPLMNEGERAELHELIARSAVDRLLGVRRIPIDSARPIHEQVLTFGSLVPLTQSMNRHSFFAIFGSTYDMQESVETNLAALGKAVDANIVFVSKIIPHAQEFDSRAIFDSGFIERNELVIPPLSGLSDKMIERFNTVRALSQSRARVPFYFKYTHPAGPLRTLIIESLVGNLFRIVGVPRRSVTTRGPKNVSEYFTVNADCAFLLDGQSTRADDYNARAEEEIFAGGRSDFARSIAAMGAAAVAARADVSASLFARIIELARKYVTSDKFAREPVIDDIFDICVAAYKAIAISDEAVARELPIVSNQLFSLAKKIWMILTESWEELRESGHDAREQAIGDIINSFAKETEFSIGESENTLMLRKLA